MYSRNHEGAEWWELFELVRKVTLIGALVLVTPEMRAATAALISIISCCVLNMYWPYRTRLVNFVMQGAYFLTTVKYLIPLIYGSGTDVSGVQHSYDLDDGTNNMLTVLLISFDVAVIVFGVLACVFIFVLLPDEFKKEFDFTRLASAPLRAGSKVAAKESARKGDFAFNRGISVMWKDKPTLGSEVMGTSDTSAESESERQEIRGAKKDKKKRKSHWASARKKSLGPISRPPKSGKGSWQFTVGMAQAIFAAERHVEEHEQARAHRQQSLRLKRKQSHARIQSRLAARKQTKLQPLLASSVNAGEHGNDHGDSGASVIETVNTAGASSQKKQKATGTGAKAETSASKTAKTTKKKKTPKKPVRGNGKTPQPTARARKKSGSL